MSMNPAPGSHGRSFLTQLRLVLAGRALVPREVAFDELGARASLGGMQLSRMGPVPSGSIKALCFEAHAYCRRVGHLGDAFMVVGLSEGRIMALVPAQPPGGTQDAERFVRLMGLLPPRNPVLL